MWSEFARIAPDDNTKATRLRRALEEFRIGAELDPKIDSYQNTWRDLLLGLAQISSPEEAERLRAEARERFGAALTASN
jgi:hypothetical protein